MTKKELDLLDRLATKYDIEYKLTGSDVSHWDFTYEWDDRKFYCEMKQRNFTLEFAKDKYSEGVLLEMHKYERILRRTKNEKSAQGLYFNFFNCGSVICFNLNKLKVDRWIWRTMPETTAFNKRRFVYKYVTFIDYDKGKLFYI